MRIKKSDRRKTAFDWLAAESHGEVNVYEASPYDGKVIDPGSSRDMRSQWVEIDGPA